MGQGILDDPTLLRQIVDDLAEGVMVFSRDGRIEYWNSGAAALTGFTAEEVVGRTCADAGIISVTDDGRYLCGERCPMRETFAEGTRREFSSFFRHREGHLLPVVARVFPFNSETGEIERVGKVFREECAPSTLLAENRKLREMALSDPLTGLYNRRRALEVLRAAHNELQRYGYCFGVLMIDIDRFKMVNDRFGHDVGDRVLRMVSRTLRGKLRSYDSVCRWGGDEFLVIMRHTNETMLRTVADKLRVLVAQTGLRVGDQVVSVTVSIGATMVSPSETWAMAVARADEMLYRCKRKGRDCVTVSARAETTAE